MPCPHARGLARNQARGMISHRDGRTCLPPLPLLLEWGGRREPSSWSRQSFAPGGRTQRVAFPMGGGGTFRASVAVGPVPASTEARCPHVSLGQQPRAVHGQPTVCLEVGCQGV